MNYINILKDIIDNFYVTTYMRDFRLERNTIGYDKVIEGDAKIICGRGRVLKDEWLNPDFYKFGPNHIQTDKTFHREDVVDFLRSNSKASFLYLSVSCFFFRLYADIEDFSLLFCLTLNFSIVSRIICFPFKVLP